MKLLTVTMDINDKLVSVPVDKVQAIAEETSTKGFISVGGSDVTTKESYSTLVEMWNDLTGESE